MKKASYAKLFVNPIAGGGKGRRLYPVVVQKLQEAGVVCDVVMSPYRGYITEAAAELAARGCETMIAYGGDGTINEVINGIAGTDTVLGIVPMGTGNDFATDMAISQNITDACAIIGQRQVKKIDLVRVNHDKFFGGVGCLGFDAEVAAFASRKRKSRSNPLFLHILGGLLKFFSYRPEIVGLRFNGHKYFGRTFLVAFGNIRSYAKGMLITPRALPDDGLLDICVVRSMPRWKVAAIFPSVYKGAHIHSKDVLVYQAESVFVQSVRPMDLYADGDFMATTPFRLEVVPNHLKVIVGPQAHDRFVHACC